MAVKLNDTLIKRLTEDGITWDTEVTGLGVRVGESGSKTFILKYRIGKGRDAQVRKPTLGRAEELGIFQARKIAKDWKAVAASGVDPMRSVFEEATAPTVAKMCEDYLTVHAPQLRASTVKADRSRIENRILPRIGRHRVKDITSRDIQDLHRAMSDTPYEANRTLALLSKMFSLAVGWGWIDRSPTKGVQKYQEEGRERYLSRDELARLSDALDAYTACGDPDRQVAADAIRLIVLTGARKNEVLAATWDQFDLAAGVWTKPSSHTKQKRKHRVPLSAPALAVLHATKERQGDDGYYICTGTVDGRRGDIKSAWELIRQAAGIEDVRVHDLRHTYASILVSGGVSLPVIGQLLGHTQQATTARYAHLSDDPLRAATNRVSFK